MCLLTCLYAMLFMIFFRFGGGFSFMRDGDKIGVRGLLEGTLKCFSPLFLFTKKALISHEPTGSLEPSSIYPG